MTVHPIIHELCDSGVHCLTQAALEKQAPDEHRLTDGEFAVSFEVDNLFPGGQFLCQHCIRFITWFAFHLF